MASSCTGGPVLAVGDTVLLDLENKRHFYHLALGSAALTYALLALLLRSRFGHALVGIRLNEQRMRAAGFSTYGYKLAAFVIAGALAGLAGFLVAVKDAAVNPELLSWHESGAVLLMIILGGLGHLRGAFIGAVAFTAAQGVLPVRAIARPTGQSLATHARLHNHRLRCLAAEGPDRRGTRAALSAPPTPAGVCR